jgi:hypothetical protein
MQRIDELHFLNFPYGMRKILRNDPSMHFLRASLVKIEIH